MDANAAAIAASSISMCTLIESELGTVSTTVAVGAVGVSVCVAVELACCVHAGHGFLSQSACMRA